jgi:flagellar M-ring protein FliF
MMMQQVERVRMLWGRLSQNQKIGLMFVGVTAILAVGLMFFLRPPQQYQTAFSGLASEDAAAIVENLQSSGVPYELTSDGTTIRVPKERVADVRLSAASAGLPKGGSVGFELFDKSSFGITEFAQQVNYQRALEGELQRTINRIDSIASSRVHIVIPEETLFSDEQQPTTAAVVIQFKPGGDLTEAQVKGVTHLVASSVPGLKPENLTVVNEAGALIWSGEDESSTFAGADDNFEMQKAYERDLGRELEAMVGRVVGNGQAAVRVSAMLNWDAKTTESEIYSPDGTQAQVRSQHETTDTTTGTTSAPGGEPGTDANTDTYQEGTTGAGSTESTSTDKTTNYELSKKVEHIVQAPGKLERLSVAVVLNGKEVDPVVTQEIQNVLTAAAGIVPARGDTITVSAVPFSEPAETLAAPSTGMLDRILPILKIVGMILVPLVAIFIGRKILLGNKSASDFHPAIPQGRAAYYQPSMAGAGNAGMGSSFSMTEVDHDPSMMTMPAMPTLAAAKQKSPAQQQVSQLAETDPAQLAQLIRIWMNEDK